MKKLLVLLPLILSGCALYDCVWHPVPEAAYKVARGNKVAHFKMKADSLTGAYARFDELYGIRTGSSFIERGGRLRRDTRKLAGRDTKRESKDTKATRSVAGIGD